MQSLFSSLEPERGRDPIVSGIFYPDDPAELKSSVDAYLKKVGRIRMDALAVVSPHAGLPYTGLLQAKALSAARSRRIENIVILSPRHTSGDSQVFLPESDFFSTPMGEIKVARNLLSEIESCGTIFATDDIPHLEEHAIEVQLPFIARLFPDASIVPLIFGVNSRVIALSVSRALEVVFQDRLDNTLFIVSTNLARGQDPQEAKNASIRFIKEAGKMDGDRIMRSAETHGSACGAYCLAALSACSFMQGKKMETLSIGDSSSIRGTAPSQPNQGEPTLEGEDTVVYAAIAYY